MKDDDTLQVIAGLKQLFVGLSEMGTLKETDRIRFMEDTIQKLFDTLTLQIEVTVILKGLLEEVTWKPIESAPKDGRWLLLRGESGYIDRPYRIHVGRWDADYRPKSPWQTSESCSFEDDGDPPTHWMEVI